MSRKPKKMREMKGQPGCKHAENHEEQTVAAEPGLLTDTVRQTSAVWLWSCSVVNNEGIKVISGICWNSMSECLILQSDSPPVCLSQSLVMERISINGSECRTFSERSTLSSALIKMRTCLLSHRILYYINTNYRLEKFFLFKKGTFSWYILRKEYFRVGFNVKTLYALMLLLCTMELG